MVSAQRTRVTLLRARRSGSVVVDRTRAKPDVGMYVRRRQPVLRLIRRLRRKVCRRPSPRFMVCRQPRPRFMVHSAAQIRRRRIGPPAGPEGGAALSSDAVISGSAPPRPAEVDRRAGPDTSIRSARTVRVATVSETNCPAIPGRRLR